MKWKLVLVSALTVACVFPAPSVSWCQSVENQKTVEIGSITVTANKMEENIQDVPQSITVIDEVILEEKGIKNITDVINEIPNMATSPDHGTAVSFRGLNPSMFTNNNPVVLYIDGVPSTDRYGFDASLVNVERIEVLRGPQGTLYGKDAIGGVVNIVTKDPSNALQGKVGTEYGSFNYMEGTFNVSGALVADKFYAGLNGQYRKDDGWIDNDYPGMNEDANRERDQRISGYVLYKPADRFRARLTISNDYAKGYWEDGYGLPGGSDIGEFDRDNAENVSYDVPTYERIESNAQSLNLSYAFDSVTITSVTTHRNLKIDGEYDADFSDSEAYAGLMMFDDAELDSWTQELRLSKNEQDGVRWVGGLYADVEDRDQGPYGMQFPSYNPVTYAFLGNYEMNAESQTDSNTYAVFGQVVVPLGLLFELTLGGRYQHIDKEIDLDTYYLPVGMTGPPMYSYRGDKSWDTFLPKVGLTYRIGDAWTAFASYSQGYMPGGFNYFATSGTAEDNRFDPEISINYEAGIKGVWDRLRLAASFFYMDIEDIHVYKAVGPGIYLTDNADSAHSQGAELEMTCRLTDTIELTGAAGIIDAEYDDYDAGGGVTFDGEKIQNTPSHTLRFGAAYLHPNGFYSRIDIKNQGDIYFYDDTNKAMVKEDSYTVVDAKIGYRLGSWDVYLYGKNLADEEYINAFRSNSMVAVADFCTPRTFGVGLRYQF